MNAASDLSMLITALLVGAALGALAVGWGVARRRRLAPLPKEWALAARRVLDVGERRVYNQLRLAFPKHLVLPKLPLVRLCQPATPDQVQYWYELIGAAHVSFAVCNPNGHVLLVVDLENNRSHSRRSTRIKESVLAACGIQRLHCAVDDLPPLDALRALVPDSNVRAPTSVLASVPLSATSEQALYAPVPAPTDAPQPIPNVAAVQPVALSDSPVDPGNTPATWQDPNVFLDSFFTGDDDANGIPWRRNATRAAGGR